MYNPYNMPMEYQNGVNQLYDHRQLHSGGQQHLGGGHSGFNLGSLGSSLLGLRLGYLGGAGLGNSPNPGSYGYGGYGGFPGYGGGGLGGYSGAPFQGFTPYGPGPSSGLGYPPAGGPGIPGFNPNMNMYGQQFQPNPGFNGYTGYGSWSPAEYGLPR